MSTQDAQLPVTTKADFGKGPTGEAARCIAEIDLFESQMKPSFNRFDKIIKRYRNEAWRDDMPSQTGADVSGRGFAMFWANVETLKPTIYAQAPKADVQRRWKDKDPVARVASEILERCLDYFIDQECFNEAVLACRNDFLTIGQGVMWHRYVPHFHDVKLRVPVRKSGTGPGVVDQGLGVTNNAEPYDPANDDGPQDDTYETYSGDPVGEKERVQQGDAGLYVERQQQEIASEEWVQDYVYWRDFGYTPGARTWAEVYCVWRKAYLTRDELIDRFGEDIGEKVRLDYSPGKNAETGQEGDDSKAVFKKATVYELWDSTTRKTCWVSRSYDGDLLDKRPYPITLSGRFPCQKPIWATQTNGQISAVPDYLQYQDQADEMDTLTQKIYVLMEAIKVRFLYAGNVEELKNLLQNASDNDGTPVDSSLLSMYGGDINKAVWFFPLDVMVKALDSLIQARERVKADAYEITGISDIIRGSSDPNETLGAQELKAQSSSIRVKDKQKAFALFVCGALKIGADIITNHFQPDSIAQICDLKTVPEALHVRGPDGLWHDPDELRQMLADQAAQAQAPSPMMGHNGGPPLPPGVPNGIPIPQAGSSAPPAMAATQQSQPGVIPRPGTPPQLAGGIQPPGPPALLPPGPTLGQAAIALLKDPLQRQFRIDIETDSTVALDEASEKQARTEFVTAIGSYLEAASQIAMSPMGAELGPLLAEILLFAVRGFKVGTQLEGAIESLIEQLQAKAKNPPPPQPDPAMVKAQADAARSKQEAEQSAQEHQAVMVENAQQAQTDAVSRHGEMLAQAQRAQADGAQAQADIVKAGIGVQTAKIGLATAAVKAREAAKPKPNGAGK